MNASWPLSVSYAECQARERLARVLDAGSFEEWLPPSERLQSPHLAQLGVPAAFDDGVAIGRARLGGKPVFVAAQEGAFMGGGVGEIHGAKLVGLFQRALRERPTAVLLLAESGGVRLHEANAGLIAVSEVMRALLDVRAAGIPVLVLIGGANGCFGGMGIVAACADHRIISDLGRLAMSGPEVIEASHGPDEFDARDRALVWRTTGGKHRWLMGDCEWLVEDDVQAFRDAAIQAMDHAKPLELERLQATQALLQARWQLAPDGADAVRLWQAMGTHEAQHIPELSATELLSRPRPMPWTAARLEGHSDATETEPDTEPATEAWQMLATALFGAEHGIQRHGDLLRGRVNFQGQPLNVVGTTHHAPIGVAMALAQADVLLHTMLEHPGEPLLLLIDTQGQQLRRRDELLGIYRAMAHLGCCIDLARRRGHRVLGLVYDQALSGGFITSGLMADACDALPQAQIRVMRIPAMARITKLSEQRLTALSQDNPVFAPGVENYVAMGGVRGLWHGALDAQLAQALASLSVVDQRAHWGAARGGRRCAAAVIQRVLDAA